MKSNNSVITLLVYLILMTGCKNQKTKSTFYFSDSFEENEAISGYTLLEKIIHNDTIIHSYKYYNLTGDTVLGGKSELFLRSQDSLFWISNGNGHVEDKALFSSFSIGKCDTTYFKFEKVINCYEGKHRLIKDGKSYNNLHLFVQTWQNINSDFIDAKIYYDTDLVPVYIENTFPISRFYRLKRIEKLPFPIKE